MSRVNTGAPGYQVATNEPSAIKMPHVLSFSAPKDEDMWVCSKDDWKHLKSRVAGLGEEKAVAWLQGIGFVFLGAGISSGLSLPAFLEATDTQKPWVIPTVIACSIGLILVSIAFLFCGWFAGKKDQKKGGKIVQDMDGIYARYQGVTVTSRVQE